MNEEKKSLIRLLVIAPLVIMGWSVLSYIQTGIVPEGILRTGFFVTVSCVVIGIWLVLASKKAVRKRTYLHVKPNSIEVEGAETFFGEFSSQTHFLTSFEKFQKTLAEVVVRKSYTTDRVIFARESAYVRIWPGIIGITELELGAVEQALNEEFIAVEIEVMEIDPGHTSQDTAIKA